MDAVITEIRTVERTAAISRVRDAFMSAMVDESLIDPDVLLLQGMSGRKYRHFINNLVRSTADARYLEVGAWAGSTLCSAINGNDVRATVIDDWSEFGGPRDDFFRNLERFRTPRAYVNIIEQDFRAVDFASLGTFDIYMFDGPHHERDHYDGIALARPALDRRFVLIVDDWNWKGVRSGTLNALKSLDISIEYGLEIRSTMDDTHPTLQMQGSDWHNGYFIGLIEQSRIT